MRNPLAKRSTPIVVIPPAQAPAPPAPFVPALPHGASPTAPSFPLLHPAQWRDCWRVHHGTQKLLRGVTAPAARSAVDQAITGIAPPERTTVLAAANGLISRQTPAFDRAAIVQTLATHVTIDQRVNFSHALSACIAALPQTDARNLMQARMAALLQASPSTAVELLEGFYAVAYGTGSAATKPPKPAIRAALLHALLTVPNAELPDFLALARRGLYLAPPERLEFVQQLARLEPTCRRQLEQGLSRWGGSAGAEALAVAMTRLLSLQTPTQALAALEEVSRWCGHFPDVTAVVRQRSIAALLQEGAPHRALATKPVPFLATTTLPETLRQQCEVQWALLGPGRDALGEEFCRWVPARLQGAARAQAFVWFSLLEHTAVLPGFLSHRVARAAVATDARWQLFHATLCSLWRPSLSDAEALRWVEACLFLPPEESHQILEHLEQLRQWLGLSAVSEHARQSVLDFCTRPTNERHWTMAIIASAATRRLPGGALRAQVLAALGALPPSVLELCHTTVVTAAADTPNTAPHRVGELLWTLAQLPPAARLMTALELAQVAAYPLGAPERLTLMTDFLAHGPAEATALLKVMSSVFMGPGHATLSAIAQLPHSERKKFFALVQMLALTPLPLESRLAIFTALLDRTSEQRHRWVTELRDTFGHKPHPARSQLLVEAVQGGAASEDFQAQAMALAATITAQEVTSPAQARTVSAALAGMYRHERAALVECIERLCAKGPQVTLRLEVCPFLASLANPTERSALIEQCLTFAGDGWARRLNTIAMAALYEAPEVAAFLCAEMQPPAQTEPPPALSPAFFALFGLSSDSELRVMLHLLAASQEPVQQWLAAVAHDVVHRAHHPNGSAQLISLLSSDELDAAQRRHLAADLWHVVGPMREASARRQVVELLVELSREPQRRDLFLTVAKRMLDPHDNDFRRAAICTALRQMPEERLAWALRPGRQSVHGGDRDALARRALTALETNYSLARPWREVLTILAEMAQFIRTEPLLSAAERDAALLTLCGGQDARAANRALTNRREALGHLPLGTLCAWIWQDAVGHERLVEADPAATAANRANMRLGLIRMLAECAPGGERMCTSGSVIRLLYPLQGYFPEVELDAHIAPPAQLVSALFQEAFPHAGENPPAPRQVLLFRQQALAAAAGRFFYQGDNLAQLLFEIELDTFLAGCLEAAA